MSFCETFSIGIVIKLLFGFFYFVVFSAFKSVPGLIRISQLPNIFLHLHYIVAVWIKSCTIQPRKHHYGTVAAGLGLHCQEQNIKNISRVSFL